MVQINPFLLLREPVEHSIILLYNTKMDQTAPVLTDQKLKYCCWTYISTCLGGYKFSNEESGITISPLAHFLQILLYMLFPLIPVIVAASSTSYTLVLVVSGVVSSVPMYVLNLLAIHKSNTKRNSVGTLSPLSYGEEELSLLTLIKAKPWTEMSIVVVVTPLYTVLAASAYYHLFEKEYIHYRQFSYLALVILEALVSCTIYYSLINSSPIEPGVLTSSNQIMGPYSSLMCRPKIAALILKLVLIGDLEEETGTLSLVCNIIYVLFPLLMILGVFSSFGSFIEYLMEQWNTLLNGSTACASQPRTILTTVVNIAISLLVAIGLKSDGEAGQYVPIIVLGILACRAKVNYLVNYGLDTKISGVLYSPTHWLKGYQGSYAQIAIEAIVILVATLTYRTESVPEFSTITGLLIVCLVLFSIGWLLCQLQKRLFINIIRSPMLQGLAPAGLVFKRLHRILQQALLCLSCLTMLNNGQTTYRLALIQAVFIQRVFQLSHTNPSILIFTEVVAWIVAVLKEDTENYGLYLLRWGVLFHLVYRTSKNVLRRVMLWPYAFFKMLTVKKQRVKQAWLLCLAQVFILLPFSLLMLVVSSILDVPYMPYLGLPLFTMGSLRPMRNWAQLQQSMKQTSEASVYNCFVAEALEKMHEVLTRGYMNLTCGQYFMVRICTPITCMQAKYLLTVQVVESSQGYLTIAIRGLESQETTSCHGVEAREVDRMVQQYFDAAVEDGGERYPSRLIHADCCGTLAPYAQFKVTSYEENQIKLTGIIESEDFIEGFKHIFLMMMCQYACQLLDESDRKMVIHMSENLFSELFHDDSILRHFPEKYSQLIGMKERFDMQANTNDEDSNKQITPKKIEPVLHQHSVMDEIGMLLDDLDMPKQNRNVPKPPVKPTRPTIQNPDDDILGMLDELDNHLPVKIVSPPAQRLTQRNEKKGHPESIYTHLKKLIILCYVLAFNDPNMEMQARVNNQLLFKLFKDTQHVRTIRQFKQSDSFRKVYDMITLSVRSALKIAIDIFSVEGSLAAVDPTEVRSSFEALRNECYVGSGSDREWLDALKRKVPALWSLGFINAQNALVVYRFSQSPVECYMFEMNEDIVRGIQANLQFELYFVTNDDDERYSIQTHQQFLRNFIIESAEEPLGYSPFYSGCVTINQ